MRCACGGVSLACLLLFSAFVPDSLAITLTWKPNAEKDLAGYKLYYGRASLRYSDVIDLKNVTFYVLDKLYLYEHVPYFIALTAYDSSYNESAFSRELSITPDDYVDHEDNCPDIYNPDQKDTYPPSGNGIGDVCDCEGDFDCDGVVDGWEAILFQIDQGRSRYNRPCTNDDPCNGDFDCDGDVDGSDHALFKADFGRGALNRPCPPCTPGPWCHYPR